MNRSLITTTVALVALSFSLVACGTKSTTTTTTSTTAATSTTATTAAASSSGAPAGVTLSGKVNDHGTATVTGAQTIEFGDDYFSPTYLKVTPGQTLTLNLKNDDEMGHTFTDPALGQDVKLSPGESKTITVTAPPSGFTEFTCTYHAGKGMRGAIVVG